MNIRSTFALPAAAGAAVLLAWSAPGVAQESGWTSGAQAYQQICAYCHDGGLVGPVLKGRGLPAEFFMVMARNGLRAMPAFPASFIDDDTLRKVGEYLSESEAESDTAFADKADSASPSGQSVSSRPAASGAAGTPTASPGSAK